MLHVDQQAGIHVQRDRRLVACHRGQVAQRRVLATTFGACIDRRIDALKDVLGRPNEDLGIVAIDDDRIAGLHAGQHIGRPADDGNVEGTRDNGDMAECRTLFEHHAAQPRAVIVEQLGGAHVARDDDHVIGQRAGIDGGAAGKAQQQAVAEILQIAQPLADIGICGLSKPGAHIVEGALHACLGREARVDGLAHALDPAAIVDEHAERFQDLALLARLHVVRFEHAIDILAHAVQSLLEALLLLCCILRNDALNDDARLVQHGSPDRNARGELHTVDTQGQQTDTVDLLHLVGADDVAGRDHFRQHHGDGLQRLDLFLVVLATRAVLHHQHAQHAAGAQDRDAGKRVIDLFAGFRPVGELWVGLRVGEGQRPTMGGNVTDQTFAHPEARAMHGRRIKTLGGEQLQHLAGAQQVDGADFGHHLVGNQARNLPERDLDRVGTRHRVPEPLEEHSRSGRRSGSLHGQTAGCLSRITTKLRLTMPARTRP